MPRTQQALLMAVEREVRACRPLALRHFRSPSLRIERKLDRSPVTAADRAIEARLRRALAHVCPGEAVVGEEFGGSGRARGTFWTVDPIDGTRAFLRGLPSWGILVGRVERGVPTMAVCDFPVLGVTLGVAPGVPAYERCGARRAPLRRAREVRALDQAVVFHGGMRWVHGTRYAAGFARLMRAVFLERAFGDCYGYLWALRGAADAVLDYGVSLWDMVPLAALARATGRVLVNFRGEPSFTGPDTIFAPPAFARRIVRFLHRRA